jgi:uncharacterized protein (TIGR02452 family)
MGRDTPTVQHVPHGARKTARSKLARHSLTHVLPSVLSSSARARSGIQSTVLHTSLAGLPRPTASYTVPRISLYNGDTLSIAHALLRPSHKVGILNMASPLRPGGGFLQGASSQEETLCLRTTLYPALNERYYRLPEAGVLYTPDILVYRDKHNKELVKKDRFFVDVATAGTLRFPDVLDGRYIREKERELIRAKMRMVMRSFVEAGVASVVLGAWGCGAYGNPVAEVVEAWRSVLVGGKRGMKEEWKGIKEMAFAVSDKMMAEEWSSLWGDGLQYAAREPHDERDTEETRDDIGGKEPPESAGARLELEGAKRDVVELKTKIEEIHEQIDSLRNVALKQRLELVLGGLENEIVEKEGLVETLNKYRELHGL